MAIFHTIWLLAACSTLVIAGPVPQHYRNLHYPRFENTSSRVSSVLQGLPAEIPSTTHLLFTASPSLLISASSSAPVNAETPEIVITPIERSLSTVIIPAVTFKNPDGQPLQTREGQTVVLTYFIPNPPTAAPPEAPSTTSSIPPETSTNEAPVTSRAKSSQQSDTASSASTSSRSDSAKHTESALSVTSYQGPQFTYQPSGSSLGASSSQTIAKLPSATTLLSFGPSESSSTTGASRTLLEGIPNTLSFTAVPSGSGAGSPASQSSSSTGAVNPPEQLTTAPSASSVISSKIGAASSTIAESSNVAQSSIVSGSSNLTAKPSLVIVTKTEFTTVFPSTTAANNPPSSLQPSNSETNAAAASSTLVPTQSSSSAGLPTTPLPLPPVVTVTRYTTVPPSPPTSAASQAPASSKNTPASGPPASSSAVSSEPLSSQVAATSSNAPVPPPSSTPIAPLLPATTVPPPSSSAPPPEPSTSSTSESKLIVTPIPASQIFTITETVTEKETVTVGYPHSYLALIKSLAHRTISTASPAKYSIVAIQDIRGTTVEAHLAIKGIGQTLWIYQERAQPLRALQRACVILEFHCHCQVRFWSFSTGIP
ncbi:uncharacterized protein BDR25DRAFT_348283 [Lindgomyces ingoldianus]|uniref:Uncharacterized protein n=1 Tax=Lindgomyces ingoldianus TaxID=673940 RepID=A0ACB6RGY0_9PLEO|nr:uncharacterized protein BDR25DRAFT_348283 [Lindgomyces ingoldianus]KAF2477985.1 hypothetical protein BDR25DRAFT_348283 [Lindgomyces ingoldianus]